MKPKPTSKPLTRRSCTGTRHGTRPAPELLGLDPNDPNASPRLRPSRMSKRRAAVLIAVHVVIIAHIVQWQLTGSTISPVEPSEAMQTLEQGRINAGFIFFCAAILTTFIFGRFVCGWGCHIVALQDLCGAMMKRVGIRPRPFRTRLLVWIPVGLAFYMFLWPTFKRLLLGPLLAKTWPAALAYIGAIPVFPGFSNHVVEENFWATFPAVGVAIPFLLICGFAVVYFLGAKGFCTYGCPYGGVFGPVDRLATGRILADLDACEGCGHCTARCTSNVRVHEEIQAYGMVVDSGCMKCMDCVSVCPNDALSFGFARPSAVARRRSKAKLVRHYDLSLSQELLLLAVFVASFLGVRGAYGLVPMLMAVGIGLSAVFVVWTFMRLGTRPGVGIHRTSLKRDGRLTGSGWGFVITGGVVLLLMVHTGFVNYHRLRAEWLDSRIVVDRGAVFNDRVSPEVRALATRARDHYVLARGRSTGGLGLVDTPGLDLRVAWLDLVRGEPAAARATLEAYAAGHGITEDLALDVARTLVMERRLTDAAAYLSEVVTEHPEYRRMTDELARLYAGLGRPDEAVAIYRAAAAHAPDDAGVRARLGSMLISAGRTGEAVTVLRQAVAIAPDDGAIRHDLAVALFANGDLDEGIQEMTRAAELAPDDPSIPARLEEMRRRAGKPVKGP